MHITLHTSKSKKIEDKNLCGPAAKANNVEVVGGHTDNFKIEDGFLRKKTNHTEGLFYQHLLGQKFGLSKFVPKCFGIRHTGEEEGVKTGSYSEITLENLCHGLNKPFVYDIKLGTKTVSFKELRAAGSRKQETICKDFRMSFIDTITSSSRRGYRFVASSNSNESRFHMGIHPDEMLNHMAENLSLNQLKTIIEELKNLLSYLQSKEGNRFEIIGASILVISEAKKSEHSEITPRVKLIDFAHSNIVSEKDNVMENGVRVTRRRQRVYQQGLQDGLKHLIEDLQQICDKN